MSLKWLLVVPLLLFSWPATSPAGESRVTPVADANGRRVSDNRPDNQARLVAQLAHTGPVYSVAFSPDGRLVLTGSQDSTASLWHAATGCVLRDFVGHMGMVRSVAFSPDGRQVLTGSWDNTARLWGTASGRELQKFEGHSGQVVAVGMSPDGRHVLTGSFDDTARLWDAAQGKSLVTFKGHSGIVDAVAFSPDGRHVLTGSHDHTARLWDAVTARESRKFAGHTGRVTSVAISPDGRRVLTGSWDASARLWDKESGRELRRFVGHENPVVSVAFSPDGGQVLTASVDMTARLWDTATGCEQRRFEGHSRWVTSIDFSPDGRTVLTGSGDGTARLWNTNDGQELRQLVGSFDQVTSVAISADGRFLLTGNSNNMALLWDAATGRKLRGLVGHSGGITSVAFSADGQQVFTGSSDKTARLWDTVTGRQVRLITGHPQSVVCVAFSPDGRHVLTGSSDAAAMLWDAATGHKLREFPGRVSSVAFSPDGRRVLTGSNSGQAQLWDTSTGEVLQTFGVQSRAVALSPDGRQVLTDSVNDESARLWDAATGREVRRFVGHSGWIASVAFSPDGRHVLTGSSDKTARLWDATTGRQRLELSGHSGFVWSVAFSPDGRRLVTGSKDNTARLWDAGTGEELCRLIGFGEDAWAVIDGAGRYDASNGGDVDDLHWVVRNEPIALSQLKERYYEPGLLAKVMGLNADPLRDVNAFADVKLFPEIQLTAPKPETPRLTIHLTDRGGGIGRVVVNINGKELTRDARTLKENVNAKGDDGRLVLRVDIARDPRLKVGEQNVIEVQVYNEDGYLRSRGLHEIYTPIGEREPSTPHVWAVVAGVSDYRGDTIDLYYAAKDAEDFAKALQISAHRLFGADKVHIRLFSTAQTKPAAEPTRSHIIEALAALANLRPQDIFILYLSGHGVNHGGQDGDYFFLTGEARSADLRDPAVRATTAISSRELTELMKQIPALKQVVILDTCAAGRLVEKLTEKRDVPTSQKRALERVKDRTGTFLLAGCAADRVSYETSRYGQGLLTYSLLLGTRGAALREAQFVDVSKLFNFAADRVPDFARDIGGIQRPILASPKGGASFDIGRVTSEDKNAIPLQPIRPLVLRSNFQDEVRVRDHLHLTRHVNARLRDASGRGRDANVVFVDAEEFPGACELVGRYRVDREIVAVTVLLVRGSDDLARFKLSGQSSAVPDLAAKIVREAEQHLATLKK